MPGLAVTTHLSSAARIDRIKDVTGPRLVCRMARRTAAPRHNVAMEHSAIVAGALF